MLNRGQSRRGGDRQKSGGERDAADRARSQKLDVDRQRESRTEDSGDSVGFVSSLLQEVERGETIVISRGRKPLAKLVPYDEAERAPRPKVGEKIDEPSHIPEEALRPMSEAELRA